MGKALLPEGAHVQGITELRGLKKRFQFLAGVGAETRESQVAFSQSVCTKRTRTAGTRDHADTVTRRHTEPGKNLGGLHHASHVIEEQHAFFATDSFQNPLRRSHAGRVAARDPCPHFRGARLDHQYGLAGRAAATHGFDEPLWVFEALDVQSDHPGVGIAGQVFYKVTELQISLVTQRHSRAEAGLVFHAAVVGGRHQRTALRQVGDSASVKWRYRHGGRGVEQQAGVGVEQAQAVGTDQSHAGAPGDLYQFLLQVSTGCIDLTEPRGDDDAAADPYGGTLSDGIADCCTRYRNDRYVDWVGEPIDRRNSRQAEDVLTSGIDRNDPACESTMNRVFQHP